MRVISSLVLMKRRTVNPCMTTKSILQSGIRCICQLSEDVNHVTTAMTNLLRDTSRLNVQGQGRVYGVIYSCLIVMARSPCSKLSVILLISLTNLTRNHKLALPFQDLDLPLENTIKKRNGSDGNEITSIAIHRNVKSTPKARHVS